MIDAKIPLRLRIDSFYFLSFLIPRQISVQNELELCQADLKRADDFNAKLSVEHTNNDDTLEALRVAKRSVERKFQGLLQENEELGLQASRTGPMEETIRGLELDKRSCVDRITVLMEQLVEKESYYESKMTDMQRELQQR